MEPVTAAIALAKFVPDIIGLFSKKKGDKAKKVAQSVVDVAQNLTGRANLGFAVDAIEGSPELQLQFKELILNDKYIAEQMRLDDVKDARDMYEKNNKQASLIAENIIKYNLVYVMGLVGVNLAAIHFFKDEPALLAVLANVVGLVLSSLLSERQAVVGFFFGSSLGSKLKSKQ